MRRQKLPLQKPEGEGCQPTSSNQPPPASQAREIKLRNHTLRRGSGGNASEASSWCWQWGSQDTQALTPLSPGPRVPLSSPRAAQTGLVFLMRISQNAL